VLQRFCALLVCPLFFIASLVLLSPQAQADAIGYSEFNAAGGLVETGVIPSLCANPLPAIAACGPDPFNLTTLDGVFTFAGDDTVVNAFGLFQGLNVSIKVTDNTGANGSLLLDFNQTYAFLGIATRYTAFDFMNGSFGGPPAAGLPDGNTNILATLTVDGAVVLPLLVASANQADALNFVRGPGFASFGTPPLAGVTFDAQALFTFKSVNQLPGDFIDLPFGISDAPEPASVLLTAGGALMLFAIRKFAVRK